MFARTQRGIGLIGTVVAVLALGACSSGTSSNKTNGTASGPLVGLFKITAGSCAGSTRTGSFFRMVQVGGSAKNGPFVTNGDSPCTDKTWSALKPGSDGGLRTGSFQPQPSPAVDARGNGLASAIVLPTKWFAVAFAVASNQKDQQTGRTVEAPSVSVSGGALSGDLRALVVAWNGQYFNQGAPKPDGSKPGNTAVPTGTYDAATGRYTLDWVSQIVGGAFNNFSGIWHLEGTFTRS